MRFEVKFAYAPQFDADIRAWAQAHALAFRAMYPPRRVNNVYFDTADLRAFEDNVAGISTRSKVRYRWYGVDALPQAGTLEFKNKRAALGWKDSYSFEDPPYHAGDTWRTFERTLRRALPPEARVVFDACGHPVLVNRYQRRYLESRDGRIRITLDADQEMFDQLSSPLPNVTRRLNVPAANVLELKCEEADYDDAAAALADCPVRVSRFSKYTLGTGLRG